MKVKYKTLGKIIIIEFIMLNILSKLEVPVQRVNTQLVSMLFFFVPEAFHAWIANAFATILLVSPIVWFLLLISKDQSFSSTIRNVTEILGYFLIICAIVGMYSAFPVS